MAKTAAKKNNTGHQAFDCFSLKAVRLVGYGASGPERLVKEAHSLDIEISMSGTVSPNEDKTRLVVNFSLAVNCKEKPKPNEEAEEVLANFTGKYQLVYGSESPYDVEKKQLEHFIKSISVKDLWPYWRELVHETSARMGISGTLLPCTVNFTDISVNPSEKPR